VGSDGFSEVLEVDGHTDLCRFLTSDFSYKIHFELLWFYFFDVYLFYIYLRFFLNIASSSVENTRMVAHSKITEYAINILNLYTLDETLINKSSYNYGLGGELFVNDEGSFPLSQETPYAIANGVFEQSIWFLCMFCLFFVSAFYFHIYLIGNIAGDQSDLDEYLMNKGLPYCYLLNFFFFYPI
jgi:hypothetical protein